MEGVIAMTTKRNHLSLVLIGILTLSLMLLSGCGSSKLVDQSDENMGTLVESIQAEIAEDGWTYSGFEVTETDSENDIATAAITYRIDGDYKELLKANTTEEANNDYIYGLAENVTVKALVELSAFDKENNTIESNPKTIEWYVGETEANAWIKEQNAKWKKVGDKIAFTTDNGSLEVTIDGASKTDWDQSSNSSYMASIRATVKNIEYKEPLYEEGVCQYDILERKDIIVSTEDGVSCSGGDILGPTDGAYDPDTKVGQGETARMCLEVIVPSDAENVILKFGDEAFLYLPIDQNTIGY